MLFVCARFYPCGERKDQLSWLYIAFESLQERFDVAGLDRNDDHLAATNSLGWIQRELTSGPMGQFVAPFHSPNTQRDVLGFPACSEKAGEKGVAHGTHADDRY